MREWGVAVSGSSRDEVIRFRVHAPLGRLTRMSTVAMDVWGIWVTGPRQTLQMGVLVGSRE